jgi:hypothetical protein
LALRQDFGTLDNEVTAISSNWTSGKINFGDSTANKMLSDLALTTTQNTETTMDVSVVTDKISGTGNQKISTSGDVYDDPDAGEGEYDTAEYSDFETVYTRFPQTTTDEESQITGRFHQFQISHSVSGETMKVEEANIGVTTLGKQQEYIE